MSFRLCLVHVKAFPENIPFFGNAIFQKGKCFHMFGCISKSFPKNIFWYLEKKKEKTNPEEGEDSAISRRRDRSARRLTSGAIAPSITIYRTARRSTRALVGRSHHSSINERCDRRSVLSDLGSLFSLSLFFRK